MDKKVGSLVGWWVGGWRDTPDTPAVRDAPKWLYFNGFVANHPLIICFGDNTTLSNGGLSDFFFWWAFDFF